MDSSIVFYAKHINYKCKISLEIARRIPTISISIEKFNEKKTNMYIYGCSDISIIAIKLYFNWKKNQEISFESSMIDWKYAMIMAANLADFDFFDEEKGPEFPFLDSMEAFVPELPIEAVALYAKQYLDEIFFYKDNWVSTKEQENALNIINRYISIEMFDSVLNRKELEDFLMNKMELVCNLSKLLYDDIVVEPKIIIEAKFDEILLMNSGIDMHYYLEIMNEWLSISYNIREAMVIAWYDYVVIHSHTGFYQTWSMFFKCRPIIGQIIWNYMDRKELLAITKIPSKKYGTAFKSSYEEMKIYVERYKPKIIEMDPRERELRLELELAQKGFRYRGCKEYVISEREITKAQINLQKYLNKHQNKEINDNPCITNSKIQFTMKMFSLAEKKSKK